MQKHRLLPVPGRPLPPQPPPGPGLLLANQPGASLAHVPTKGLGLWVGLGAERVPGRLHPGSACFLDHVTRSLFWIFKGSCFQEGGGDVSPRCSSLLFYSFLKKLF